MSDQMKLKIENYDLNTEISRIKSVINKKGKKSVSPEVR